MNNRNELLIDYLYELSSPLWSPATNRMVNKVLTSIQGVSEEEKTLILEKWIEYWEANPEIHF